MLIASFSQSIKRPTLASMTGVATINEETLTGTIPNLELKAETGNNYSTRLEYYFEPAGTLSAGVFQMDGRNITDRVGSGFQISPAPEIVRRDIYRAHGANWAFGVKGKL